MKDRPLCANSANGARASEQVVVTIRPVSVAFFLVYVDAALTVASTKWVIGVFGTFEPLWTCRLTWILVRDGVITSLAVSSVIQLTIILHFDLK